MCVDLIEIDHQQPMRPMKVDDETAMDFLKDKINQKHSKIINLQFYWVKNRVF